MEKEFQIFGIILGENFGMHPRAYIGRIPYEILEENPEGIFEKHLGVILNGIPG